jgi:hypothetical protein
VPRSRILDADFTGSTSVFGGLQTEINEAAIPAFIDALARSGSHSLGAVTASRSLLRSAAHMPGASAPAGPLNNRTHRDSSDLDQPVHRAGLPPYLTHW